MPGNISIMDEPKVEENLNDIKISILRKQRSYLCKYLTPSAYMAYLRSKFILSEEDQSLIESKIGRKRQAEALLDILEVKGFEAYDRLTKAIQLDKTQGFLVKELQRIYETERNEYLALLQGKQLQHDLVDISTTKLPKPPARVNKKEMLKNLDDDGKNNSVSSNANKIGMSGKQKVPKFVSLMEEEKNTYNGNHFQCGETEEVMSLQNPTSCSTSTSCFYQSSPSSLCVSLHRYSGDPCEHSSSPDSSSLDKMKINVDGEEITLTGPPSAIPSTVYHVYMPEYGSENWDDEGDKC